MTFSKLSFLVPFKGISVRFAPDQAKIRYGQILVRSLVSAVIAGGISAAAACAPSPSGLACSLVPGLAGFVTGLAVGVAEYQHAKYASRIFNYVDKFLTPGTPDSWPVTMITDNPVAIQALKKKLGPDDRETIKKLDSKNRTLLYAACIPDYTRYCCCCRFKGTPNLEVIKGFLHLIGPARKNTKF